MRNTLKHLTLLTRMKDDGLLPVLTGSFSEDAIEQACGQVETLQFLHRQSPACTTHHRALQSSAPESVLPVSALSFGCAAVSVIEVSPPVHMPALWHPLKSCL